MIALAGSLPWLYHVVAIAGVWATACKRNLSICGDIAGPIKDPALASKGAHYVHLSA
jgi:hypothetical protein